MFVPNEGQSVLCMRLLNWYRNPDKQIFVYTGGPGTGKTSALLYFIEHMRIDISDVLPVAYSGKAVNVLCDKGFYNASTIHSAFYEPVRMIKKDEFGNTVEDDYGNPKITFDFVLKQELASDYKLIVIDELSMVPDNIMEDILSFGIPVIGMGDVDQLPPIFGICSYMLRPDYYLTEIMRQDKDNPIISFCQWAKFGDPLRCGTYGDSRILSHIDYGENLVDDYDMIICCRNNTRDGINDIIRKDIFHREDYPVLGDKLICRQNLKDFSEGGRFLTNGTIGYLIYTEPGSRTSKKMTIDFTPDYDDSIVFQNVIMDMKYISQDHHGRSAMGLTKYVKFEYGNVITAHLSQGSEYNRVLYIDEPFGSPELRRKLRYTAISRAAKSIDIVTNSAY